MERLILKQLLEWRDSPYSKPLILKGRAAGMRRVFSRNLVDAAMKICPF